MPKKIIICADGTWNTENQTDQGHPCSTNVVKLARALRPRDANGVEQVVYYHSGVGTNIGQRLSGGAFGAGIFANVRECYRFIVHNYAPGDALYFFGFSRGAYTVRSLAGLIRKCGILRRGEEERETEAVDYYRSYLEADAPDGPRMQNWRQDHAYQVDQEIEMIGVWDTVGALGIPGLNGLFRLSGGLDWQFHDVKLSSFVKHAFHALAIHEHRKEFLPALWEQSANGAAKGQRLEQVWFSGVHSDVGGGYPECGLADITLLWMIERSKECGLEFEAGTVGQIVGQALADAHDSFSTLYKVIDFLGNRPEGTWRTLGPGEHPGFERVHPTAVERFHRRGAPKYWPPTFEEAIARETWPLGTSTLEGSGNAGLKPPAGAHDDHGIRL